MQPLVRIARTMGIGARMAEGGVRCPVQLARFVGTRLWRRLVAVFDHSRHVHFGGEHCHPLLVPLYCAPLAALRGLWRAFGASSADAKGALASFHSAIIDASVTDSVGVSALGDAV